MVASTTETSFNKITFNLKNFRAYLFIYRLKLKQFEKLNGSQKSFNLNKLKAYIFTNFHLKMIWLSETNAKQNIFLVHPLFYHSNMKLSLVYSDQYL